jgi:hypothetical protein
MFCNMIREVRKVSADEAKSVETMGATLLNHPKRKSS